MRMILITAILIWGITATTQAQSYLFSEDDRRTQTLFNEDIRHGGQGGLIFGATHINGQLSYLRGRRGAWIINFDDDHAINLGLGSYRTRTDFDPVNWTLDIPEPDLKTNYGGFEIEYVNQSYRLVHFSIQALIGSGSVRYDDRNIELDKTRDTYFVLQPGANLNLNVTHWFRVQAGMLYRYAGSVSLEGTSNSDLSGATGFIGLRFGSF